MKNITKGIVAVVLVLGLAFVVFTVFKGPITDIVKSMIQNSQTNTAQNTANKTLKDNTGYAMSGSTSKALNTLVKSTNALSEAQADANAKPKKWADKIPILGGMLPTKHNLAQKKLAEASADQYLAQRKADTAIASDKTLAKDKKAREQAAQQKNSGILQKVAMGAGIVIALIILLLLFKKLKKKPVEEPEEPKPEEEVKEHTGLLEVNYDSLLKDNCGKCDLNAAEISNMFDGNTRLASDAVQYCVTKGMKGDAAMEYVKKKAQHFKDYGN